MSKVMISPSRYVQGVGAIHEIGTHIKNRGTKALVFGGKKGLKSVRAAVEASLVKAGMTVIFEQFGGECSKKEIDRMGAIVKENEIDIIVGVGGGKALDTAKATLISQTSSGDCATIAATDLLAARYRHLYVDGYSNPICCFRRIRTWCWLIPKLSPTLLSVCLFPAWETHWLPGLKQMLALRRSQPICLAALPQRRRLAWPGCATIF